MTIISAFITSGVPTDDAIYLASDSRVNFATDQGMHLSNTDEASKIIVVNDYIVIGYAGDYYKANLAIEAIRKDIIDLNNNIFDIAVDLSNQLRENFTGQNTSFLIFVKKEKWYGYQVESNTFIPQPKSLGLHLIGMGEEEQEEFRKAYDQSFKDNINPPSIDGLYTIPLLSAYHHCFSQDVNGIISFYILNNLGITRPGIGVNNDNTNWLVYSPEKHGTIRIVNGKNYGSTSQDFSKIKTKSALYHNDLRKFLNNKKR
jgi:ATP-dependent protease HslVU (ClpYQ) peptidase subunit